MYDSGLDLEVIFGEFLTATAWAYLNYVSYYLLLNWIGFTYLEA